MHKVCHARIGDGLCHRTNRLAEYNEHCKANDGKMLSFQFHFILQPMAPLMMVTYRDRKRAAVVVAGAAAREITWRQEVLERRSPR